jgi:hypothetical protein
MLELWLAYGLEVVIVLRLCSGLGIGVKASATSMARVRVISRGIATDRFKGRIRVRVMCRVTLWLGFELGLG